MENDIDISQMIKNILLYSFFRLSPDAPCCLSVDRPLLSQFRQHFVDCAHNRFRLLLIHRIGVRRSDLVKILVETRAGSRIKFT